VKSRFFINFTVNRLGTHRATYSTKQVPQQSHGLERPLRCLHHFIDSRHESLPILFFHLELPDALADATAVHRSQRKCFEHQHVERAPQKVSYL
jgi:hypothetical protein